MTIAQDAWIGLDLGTSSLKAAVIDEYGNLLAASHHPYATSRPEPGAAEQDPADWIAATRAALHELRKATPAADWRGLTLAGMIPSLVTIGPDARSLGPVITWEDGRAEGAAAKLRDHLGAEHIYTKTGQHLDGRYLLPMWLRLREAESERARATTMLLGAKDYLFHYLTGEAATDPSTAAGYGCYDLRAGGWDEEIAAAAGVSPPGAQRASSAGSSRPALPPVLPSSASRPLRPALAASVGLPTGLPIHLGAADSVLGAVGIGAGAPGEVAYLMGTSTVILATAPLDLTPGPWLVTPLLDSELTGQWGYEMDLVSTGSALHWLAGITGSGSVADLMQSALSRPPGGGEEAFMPYLGGGEQGALWDPSLRGAMFGLSLTSTRGSLARALLDGIVLESRRCVAALRERGIAVERLLVCGANHLHPLPRDLANATGCEVIVQAPEPSASARGAAQLALSAGGGGPALRQQPTSFHAPHPEPRARWDELWRRHERLLAAARVAGSRG
jgi:sugar (pentulose or hexulose) kinase